MVSKEYVAQAFAASTWKNRSSFPNTGRRGGQNDTKSPIQRWPKWPKILKMHSLNWPQSAPRLGPTAPWVGPTAGWAQAPRYGIVPRTTSAPPELFWGGGNRKTRAGASTRQGLGRDLGPQYPFAPGVSRPWLTSGEAAGVWGRKLHLRTQRCGRMGNHRPFPIPHVLPGGRRGLRVGKISAPTKFWCLVNSCGNHGPWYTERMHKKVYRDTHWAHKIILCDTQDRQQKLFWDMHSHKHRSWHEIHGHQHLPAEETFSC